MTQSSPTLQEILSSDDKAAILALFKFTLKDSNELIIFKFGLYSRKFFPKYFKGTDADFHKQIDENNLNAYRGSINSFTDIVFRGGAKTTRTKLFLSFCIANDTEHFRKYIKILSEDTANSKQIVTDIYNMFVDKEIKIYYPEIFAKTVEKREETMGSFTTATGIRVLADTVGTSQRGQLQEDSRPDLILFEDFETRKTIKSAVLTQSIWDNMEEARTGLAKGGACIYNCNYLSERGNVHKLVAKKNEDNIVLIVPIIKDGVPTWSIYTKEDIEQIKHDADDFEGEYQCNPAASKNVLFDRSNVDRQVAIEPIKELNYFKIFKEFDPSHRYASGHDVAGGVGLDSSTSVFIDFSTVPCQVVGTYANNTIKPDVFGDEIKREAEKFGECLVAPEKNNHGHATIGRLKQIYENIYITQKDDDRFTVEKPKEYGWETNGLTKPKMLLELSKALENGWINLNDKDLIAEARSYTRDDLMDKDVDVRLTTRHFDLLIACAIAYQMKDWAITKTKEFYTQPAYIPDEFEGIPRNTQSELIATPTGGKVNFNAVYSQQPIE